MVVMGPRDVMPVFVATAQDTGTRYIIMSSLVAPPATSARFHEAQKWVYSWFIRLDSESISGWRINKAQHWVSVFFSRSLKCFQIMFFSILNFLRKSQMLQAVHLPSKRDVCLCVKVYEKAKSSPPSATSMKAHKTCRRSSRASQSCNSSCWIRLADS